VRPHSGLDAHPGVGQASSVRLHGEKTGLFHFCTPATSSGALVIPSGSDCTDLMTVRFHLLAKISLDSRSRTKPLLDSVVSALNSARRIHMPRSPSSMLYDCLAAGFVWLAARQALRCQRVERIGLYWRFRIRLEARCGALCLSLRLWQVRCRASRNLSSAETRSSVFSLKLCSQLDARINPLSTKGLDQRRVEVAAGVAWRWL
jgi:hypothetical protein